MTDRVLVTGGTGFLGRHLIRVLQQQRQLVRTLVRPQSAGQALTGPGLEVIVGDLLAPDSLPAALEDVTTVFHLAGKLHMPGVPAQMYQQLHVEGTRNLLRACLQQPTLQKIVYCSTTGVLGPTDRTPVTEDTPPLQGPSNAYEQSKAMAEQLAVNLASQYSLPLIVARPALVYGPGDLHLLGWFRAIQRGYYRVVGSGDNFLHPIYIDDLIAGLLACAQATGPAGRAYQLVGPQPIPIREVAAAIAKAVGRPLSQWHLPLWLARVAATLLERLPGIPPALLPLTHSRLDFMIENRAYCGDRARLELGFVPQIDLETGLQRTVTWYRQEGLL